MVTGQKNGVVFISAFKQGILSQLAKGFLFFFSHYFLTYMHLLKSRHVVHQLFKLNTNRSFQFTIQTNHKTIKAS